MVLTILILSILVCIVSSSTAVTTDNNSAGGIAIVSFVIIPITFIYGVFMGFYPHRSSEGIQFGIVSAVDREGYFGNKWKVYIKSSTYTGQSDESVYCLYNDEKELASKSSSLIGQKVVIKYAGDGGYYSSWSCGENHIKEIEIKE